MDDGWAYGCTCQLQSPASTACALPAARCPRCQSDRRPPSRQVTSPSPSHPPASHRTRSHGVDPGPSPSPVPSRTIALRSRVSRLTDGRGIHRAAARSVLGTRSTRSTHIIARRHPHPAARHHTASSRRTAERLYFGRSLIARLYRRTVSPKAAAARSLAEGHTARAFWRAVSHST